MTARINFAGPAKGDAERAFTLAEVCVASFVFGIMMTSLYGAFATGFSLIQVTRENLRATQIMLERMEGVRLYNWNQLVYSNMIPTAFTSYYYPLATGNDSRGVPYAGTLSITTPALSPPVSYVNDMRLITVAISWTNTYGKQKIVRSRQMQTYVGRMGMQNYIFNN